MDMEDIHYLLGGTIFERAKNYMKHIESFDCETEEMEYGISAQKSKPAVIICIPRRRGCGKMAVSSVQAVPVRITIMAMGFFVSTSVRCCCMT